MHLQLKAVLFAVAIISVLIDGISSAKADPDDVKKALVSSYLKLFLYNNYIKLFYRRPIIAINVSSRPIQLLKFANIFT